MTARKPKPKPRKASGRPLEERVHNLETLLDLTNEWALAQFKNHLGNEVALEKRLDALESRASLRDKSHDEPVSNAGEAIGQHFRIVGERRRWWQFWRRA